MLTIANSNVHTFQFLRGDFEADVTFEFMPGRPARLTGKPEDCDMGDLPKVEFIRAVVAGETVEDFEAFAAMVPDCDDVFDALYDQAMDYLELIA